MKPVLRPALRSALSSIVGAIRRYFTSFDPVAQTYVQMSSPITLAGDFNISFDAQIPENGGHYLSDTNSNDGARDRFGLFFSSDILSVYGLGFNGVNSGLAASNKLHRFEIKRVGALTEFSVDGHVKATNTDSSAYTLNSVSGRITTTAIPFLQGVMADLKIINAGTTVLDMPLDGSDYESNTTVIDKSPSGNNGTAFNFAAADTELFTFDNGNNYWLGVELATDLSAANGSSAAISYTGGERSITISSDGTQSYPNVRFDIVAPGLTYLVSATADITNTTNSNFMSLRDGSASERLSFPDSSIERVITDSMVTTAASQAVRFYIDETDISTDVGAPTVYSGVSIKRVLGVAQ